MEIVPSPRARRPRRAGRLALGVVAALFVLLGVVAALPIFLGMERIAMADDAMGPALPRGSYVLMERVPAEELAVGDVVSFRDPVGDGSIVRRVTAMNGGWLRLDGDVAGTESTTMRAVRVRRVVSHTPWAGYPLLVLGSWPAPYLIVGVVGATLLAGLRMGGARRRRSPFAPVPAPSLEIPHPSAPASLAEPSVPRTPAILP